MNSILLTGGYAAVVDDDDYESLNSFKWHAHRASSRIYARRNTSVLGKQIHVHMSRQILDATAGTIVDHINRDTLDNRRLNLRFVTKSQSDWNRKHPVGICGFTGVRRYRCKYQARIRTGERLIDIGIFQTAIEAALAYDKVALIERGEFAVLNFPEGKAA
jgi:hypothetical protein